MYSAILIIKKDQEKNVYIESKTRVKQLNELILKQLKTMLNIFLTYHMESNRNKNSIARVCYLFVTILMFIPSYI